MMPIRSVRRRLLFFAGIGAVAAVLVLGLSLLALFDRYAVRRAGFELRNYLVQLEGALNADATGIDIRGGPPNPRFTVLGSGLYWQVTDLDSGATARSPSLDRQDLPPPAQDLLSTTTIYNGELADGRVAVLLARGLVLQDTSASRRLRVLIAMDRREMDDLREGFAVDMLPGLLVLIVLIVAAAWLQVTLGLRPLDRMREQIRHIRDGSRTRLATDFPIEVEPLASELNSLLDARAEQIGREKNRAADLAHGLKTPLTALSSDSARVRALGHDALARDIEGVAQQMRQVVERELARARLWSQAGAIPRTEVMPLVESVARTLRRTPNAQGKTIEIRLPDDLAVAMHPNDLLEVMGNLLENAVRAARDVVRITGDRVDATVRLVVEDDGQGVPVEDMPYLTERGQQLGRTSGTAGIGLTIVADILARYGAKPDFAVAGLGGLRVMVVLTSAPRAVADRQPRPRRCP